MRLFLGNKHFVSKVSTENVFECEMYAWEGNISIIRKKYLHDMEIKN